MYVPSTTVLSKILNRAFEIAKKQELAAGRLTGIETLFMNTMARTGTGDYGWIGDIPLVREWIGSKVYSDLKEYEYQIINKDWYTGFSIHKNALRRDELDSIRPRMQMLVQAVLQWKAEMVINFLINGTTYLAHDGVAFFANISGNRLNDNLLAGSGVTLANLKTDLAACRKAAMTFVDDKSTATQPRYLRIMPDTIICPLDMEVLFLEIAESVADPGGTHAGVANVQKRFIKNVIPLPDLSDVNDWYYATTNRVLKPFIFQSENLEGGRDVLLVTDDTKLQSDGVYGYSAEMCGNAGFGFPELCLKVVNS